MRFRSIERNTNATPERVEHEAHPHDDGCADLPDQPASDLRADDHEQAGGQEPQAVARGREVLAVLQEDRQHEAEPELAHREHETGEQPVAVALQLQVRELEQRRRVASLLAPFDEVEAAEDRERDHEHDRHDRNRAGRRPDHPTGDRELLDRRQPPVGAAFTQREHEQEHSGRDEERAEHVDLHPARVLTLSLMNTSAPMIASGAMITLIRNDQRHE